MVYCSVVQHGTETEWNFLWNKFKSTSVVEEQEEILKALGCTKRADLITVKLLQNANCHANNQLNLIHFQKYLELILTDQIRLSKYEAFSSTLTHKQNVQLVLDFFITEHKTIDKV